MKTLLFSILAVVLMSTAVNAQKFITKTGYIRFYSDAPLEKIEAINRQVNAAMDIGTGDFVFKVLMRSFVFEKALMQEHFNENYVESVKYPNATFVGKVTNLADVKFTTDGTYPAIIEGKLTIKGVTKEVKQTGTFEVKGSTILGRAKFNLTLSDYNISIPTAVNRNIGKTVEVTVDVALDKLNN